MEDRNQVNGVRLMKWNQNFPMEFYDESVRVAYKSTNSDYIKRNIREKIRRCSGTVCFIGGTTFQSDWVNWEVQTSIEEGNEILLMGLPNGAQRLKLPAVVTGQTWWLWDPNRLAKFAE